MLFRPKAFDSVCRRLLWQRLYGLGVCGSMLAALLDIYSDVKFQVKLNGKISSGYVVSVSGVKQGCPISPVLFGVFIEELSEFLRERCADIGVVVIGEDKLRDLLYADDGSLLGFSIGEVQRLCAVLEEFCDVKKLTVNVDKTEVARFKSDKWKQRERTLVPEAELVYGEHSIRMVDSFKYLGLPFHESRWLSTAADFMATRAS